VRPASGALASRESPETKTMKKTMGDRWKTAAGVRSRGADFSHQEGSAQLPIDGTDSATARQTGSEKPTPQAVRRENLDGLVAASARPRQVCPTD